MRQAARLGDRRGLRDQRLRDVVVLGAARRRSSRTAATRRSGRTHGCGRRRAAGRRRSRPCSRAARYSGLMAERALEDVAPSRQVIAARVRLSVDELVPLRVGDLGGDVEQARGGHGRRITCDRHIHDVCLRSCLPDVGQRTGAVVSAGGVHLLVEQRDHRREAEVANQPAQPLFGPPEVEVVAEPAEHPAHEAAADPDRFPTGGGRRWPASSRPCSARAMPQRVHSYGRMRK